MCRKDLLKRGGNMRNELDDQNNLILSRTGSKTTRPCDVLQSDELGIDCSEKYKD